MLLNQNKMAKCVFILPRAPFDYNFSGVGHDLKTKDTEEVLRPIVNDVFFGIERYKWPVSVQQNVRAPPMACKTRQPNEGRMWGSQLEA